MEKFKKELENYKFLREKQNKNIIDDDTLEKEYFLKKSFVYILMCRGGIIPKNTLSKKEYLQEIEENLKNTLNFLIEKIQKIEARKNISKVAKKEKENINNIIIEICVILEQIDFVLLENS